MFADKKKRDCKFKKIEAVADLVKNWCQVGFELRFMGVNLSEITTRADEIHLF